MRLLLTKAWKQAAILGLLIGVDLAVSLPIMGATYRPFSWMSIAPADASTLYPVIQNIRFENGRAHLSVAGNPAVSVAELSGTVVLQRSTNLLNTSAWTDVVTLPAMQQDMDLVDTNPVTGAVFYRVLLFLKGSP